MYMMQISAPPGDSGLAHLAAQVHPLLLGVALGVDHLLDGATDEAGASGDHDDLLRAHCERFVTRPI